MYRNVLEKQLFYFTNTCNDSVIHRILIGDIVTRIERSIEINTSPEKVWELLAWDRCHEWMDQWRKNLISLEYTSDVHTPDDKYRLGASAQGNIKGLGMGEFTLEITESLENEKMTYTTKRLGSTQQIGSITFLLTPLEEGTKFTYTYDYEMPWGAAGKLLNRMGGQRGGERMLETDIANLKRILEQ